MRTRCTSPACGGGRRAQRGGWGKSLSRPLAVVVRRHPHPNPPPQAGEGAQQRKLLGALFLPLPLAGEVAARSAAGGGNPSATSSSSCAERAPTPTLPRKRERGRSGASCWARCSYLSRLRGRSPREARRVGEISPRPLAVVVRREPPPQPLPQPSPASGRGGAAAQAAGRTVLTSPACGGGRRAKRGGWGKSLRDLWQQLCGGTPTPTLSRKRERGRSSASCWAHCSYLSRLRRGALRRKPTPGSAPWREGRPSGCRRA